MISLDKKPRKCLNCGKEYLQRSLRQKYCGDRKTKTGCSFNIKRENTRLYLVDYSHKNRKRLAILSAKWREKNADKIRLQKAVAWRKNHPLIIHIPRTKEQKIIDARLRNREYYYRNRARLNKKQNENTQKRIKSDIGYRLLVRMRFRLWDALKNRKNGRKTLDLIGCDINTLKSHLEAQFEKGMSWKNYGKKGWSVDHIYPLSRANLNNEIELKKVCHYTNLQPLWCRDNLLKGNRV